MHITYTVHEDFRSRSNTLQEFSASAI